MTKIRVKKKHGVLVPSLPHDALYFESIPSDTILEFDFIKKRNALFHDKYFAMLNVVLKHTDKWVNIDQLRKRILINIGHFDMVYDPVLRELVPEAKSIAWAQLDEVKFNRIYQDSLTVILEYYMPDQWNETLFNQALNEIMDFA